MDSEEIEAWYDENKEKLTEEYKSRLEKGGRPENLKKKFVRQLDRLHGEYEKKSGNFIKKDLRDYFMKHKLQLLKDKLSNWFKNLKEKMNIKS